jgi:hypothetical protein
MRKSGEVRAEDDGIENPLLMAISIAATTTSIGRGKQREEKEIDVVFFAGDLHPSSTPDPTHQLHTPTMMRSAFLLALAIGSGADAFKFMSNFQPAKILTNDQKVELAKTKERFGDKSKCSRHIHSIDITMYYSNVKFLYVCVHD